MESNSNNKEKKRLFGKRKAKQGKGAEASQQRSHFRLPYEVAVEFKLVNNVKSDDITTGEANVAAVSNLSGGGLKLMTYVDLKVKQIILITVPLNDDVLFATGEVRAKYSEPHDVYPYQYGIMFIGISSIDQDKIMRYLFQEEQKYMASPSAPPQQPPEG
jgi:c-di-GMP-binding flagellar brake protein YcgR